MPSIVHEKKAADGEGDEAAAAAEPEPEDGAAKGTTEPLEIILRGRAVRPVCHFELVETTDYLPRRAPNLLNELGKKDQIQASSVRCVEVKSVGTRVRNTKRFHVVNPTNATFDFEWVPCGEPNSAWRCGTPKGMIISGKRGEMIFEYTPDVVGVAEAFFRFRIPAHGVDELFLFAGSVVEPRVSLDRTRVDFAALMVGTLATETIHIVNNEHLPFSFAFDKEAVSLSSLSLNDEGKSR